MRCTAKKYVKYQKKLLSLWEAVNKEDFHRKVSLIKIWRLTRIFLVEKEGKGVISLSNNKLESQGSDT
jgi:hypothetical protein